MIDTENKQFWCIEGVKLESDFINQQPIDGWKVVENPEKAENEFAHDFTVVVKADLKSMQTPWKYAQSMFGIPSHAAISINGKDFMRYSRLYPNILIICDVRYELESDGVYIMTLPRARALLKEGKAVRHDYKNRVDDTEGNAKFSYVFDVRCLDKLEAKNVQS
jgi:hypothetical protein